VPLDKQGAYKRSTFASLVQKYLFHLCTRENTSESR
jgi:hypothetical protein